MITLRTINTPSSPALYNALFQEPFQLLQLGEENYDIKNLILERVQSEGNQTASALIQTVDGGFVLAGCTDSTGAGGKDMWLVKTDGNGVAQWNQTYGGTRDEHLGDLIQTMDGGYALVGETYSYSAGNADFWLVKTDGSGQVEWNKTFGGSEKDSAISLIQTADEEYVLAGTTDSGSVGDFWMIKTKTNGEEEWNYTYGGIDMEFLYSLIQTADGGYALAGWTFSYGAGNGDFWLVKTDTTGQVEWNRTYGRHELSEQASDLIQTVDGGFVLVGVTYSLKLTDDADTWLIKTDTTGQVEWNRTLGDEDSDYGSKLIQTSDGGLALAGNTQTDWSGAHRDMWLVKTNETGDIQWEYTYGGPGSESAWALLQTTEGGYALAGSTNSFGIGDRDMWLVKTNSMGSMQWNQTYGGLIEIPETLTISTISSEASESSSHPLGPILGLGAFVFFVITMALVIRRLKLDI
ncbi:MAG: hypothetical protein ACFFDC_12035 [Promethearchaeota archaeon]